MPPYARPTLAPIGADPRLYRLPCAGGFAGVGFLATVVGHVFAFIYIDMLASLCGYVAFPTAHSVAPCG